MARQVITTLIDDIDGSEAAETVRFGLDGIAYEIDLSGTNALDFREKLAKFIAAGSRLPNRVGASRGATVSGGRREETRRIREWAEAHGWPVNDRGRISREIEEAYRNGTMGPNFSAPKSAPVAESKSGSKAGGTVADTSGGKRSPENTSEAQGINGATKGATAAPEAVSVVPTAVLSAETVSGPVEAKVTRVPRKPAARITKAADNPFSGKAVAAAAGTDSGLVLDLDKGGIVPTKAASRTRKAAAPAKTSRSRTTKK